ncbi:hypothetical protein ACHHV8_09760 [Paenibacillus sp. TAB 01]
MIQLVPMLLDAKLVRIARLDQQQIALLKSVKRPADKRLRRALGLQPE